jgi:flagellar motor switch protein FliM
LNLAVPVTVSHALLRKISADESVRRPRGRSDWRDRLKALLLECLFPVELEVNGLSAPVSELSQLQPGQLLCLRRSVRQPAALLVAGVEMFHAAPARARDMRVAQVLTLEEAPDAPAGSSGSTQTKKGTETKK